jgi:hypothetical protein
MYHNIIEHYKLRETTLLFDVLYSSEETVLLEVFGTSPARPADKK